MSAMIRTLAKARLLNTGNQVMKQTMIRKYNTNAYDTLKQSKLSDIDPLKLFIGSEIVGGVLGCGMAVKMYKDDIDVGCSPDPFDFGIMLATGTVMGACYYVSAPIYLLYSYANQGYYKRKNK